MKKIALHWQVIIGLTLGALFAFASITFGWNTFTNNYIQPFGDIFIKLMKMIAVPMVLFSIISGMASMKNIGQLGRMGGKTLGLYLLTTVFAVSMGLLVVNLIGPGKRINSDIRKEFRVSYELWRNDNPDVVMLDDICLSCDPDNADIVKTVIEKEGKKKETVWVKNAVNNAKATKSSKPLQPLVDAIPSNILVAMSKPSMLQVIFFAILFGITLTQIPEKTSSPVLKVVQGLDAIFVKMVLIIMKAMPLFVFALMAGQIVKAAGNDPSKFKDVLEFLLYYSVTLIFGLGILVLLVYPNLIKLITRGLSYKDFFKGMRDAHITAFSTSSSLATLPITMKCMHDNFKISERTTSFVLPIGATINMDGTSMYQAVAVVALAQLHMVDLSISQQLVIVMTASLASIGAAAIPSAGLVLMIIVLESVGLNPLWIGLIFPMDRILDMCRTVVNVTGDATVATIVDRTEQSEHNT